MCKMLVAYILLTSSRLNNIGINRILIWYIIDYKKNDNKYLQIQESIVEETTIRYQNKVECSVLQLIYCSSTNPNYNSIDNGTY